MSNQWFSYPRKKANRSAAISFDYGVRKEINQSPTTLLRIQIAYKAANPNGQPTPEEFQNLALFENALTALIEQHKGLYVGRVSTDGHLNFYVYISESAAGWESITRALASEHDYPVVLSARPDADHDTYWKVLFPTADEWQLIKDMQVLAALRKHGDDGTATRRVDHWSYFASHAAANQFTQWLAEQKFSPEPITQTEKGQYCVRFNHEGTMQLQEISAHTIVLRRKAHALGGEYDGWETALCKKL